MDLHTWMVGDLAAMRTRLYDGVLAKVPHPRWAEQVDGGGSSLAHLVLHIARHQDLAVTTAVRDHEPLFESHRVALGFTDAAAWVGLSEREDPGVSAVPTVDALVSYLDDVFASTAAWLAGLGSMVLDSIPDVGRRLTDRAHLPIDELGWLHSMWADRPVWWFVQWPVIGHGHTHTGEATALRNRLGLSPF
jgi:hypothetical protein